MKGTRNNTEEKIWLGRKCKILPLPMKVKSRSLGEMRAGNRIYTKKERFEFDPQI